MPTNERLRHQRVQRNWRQQDLADELGIALTTVQRWERGIQHPGPYYRAKLCALFGLTTQELGLLVDVPSLEGSALVPTAPTSGTFNPSEVFALWTIPLARNPHFTGRDEQLEQLEQKFAPHEGGMRQAALTQASAIKGLGGVGKTQIAVEYAYRSQESGRYTHTIWINAANEETLLASFVDLAKILPSLPARDETDQHKLVAAVIRWLEQCSQPWLLICDNADDLSFLPLYLPARGNGNILFTTRASAVGAFASSIAVESMGLVEATQLLLRRAHRETVASEEEIDEASNIAVALAQFPLALDQAGAYIEETGCSLREYLQLYYQHQYALLARRGKQATHYPAPVATTWSLSFAHVEQTNPAAAELLQLSAFLAPDRIPEELLTEGASYWPPALREAAADRFRFNQMLEDLLSFSLVKRLAEDRLLSIHRLVQLMQREWLPLEEVRQWAEQVVRALQLVFPANPREVASWPQCQRYLEQLQVCDTLIREQHLLLPEAADLLGRAGVYLSERGLYTLAESLLQQAFHMWKQLADEAHPNRVQAMNNLARLCVTQGKYAEAESVFQQILRIAEQRVEFEQPLQVEALRGLGQIYTNQGKYTQAKPLLEQALRIWEQEVGSEHPLLVQVLIGLAFAHTQQGELTEAKILYYRALRIQEQQFGPEHMQVSYPLLGLAHNFTETGEYDRAEPLYQRALSIWERDLGPEHLAVAVALHELAKLYAVQGRYTEAESLFQRALRIREEQLGPEHVMVSATLRGLADLYAEQGEYATPEPLYQRALQIREQQLGPQSAPVADPLRGLANLYTQQGKYLLAEPLYQRALHLCEQQLGTEHLETARVLHDFAGCHRARGQTTEAAQMYQRALAIRDTVLGPNDPLTSDTRERLHAVVHQIEEMAQSNG